MKKIILDRLLLKCHIMAESQPVPYRRILLDMAAEPEKRLLPAIRGEMNLVRIRYVGSYNVKNLRTLLNELKNYLKRLEAYPADANGDPDYKKFDKDIFYFDDLEPWMERRVQLLYDKMFNEIPDSRARHILADYDYLDYKKTEVFYQFPQYLYRMRGAGENSVRVLKQFLDDFQKAYREIAADGGERAHKLYDIGVEYPFLTDEEVEFVYDFLHAEGRYPVFFLARRFMQASTLRGVRAYARYNGIFGRFESLSDLAGELGVTLERVRQLSKIDIGKFDTMTWDVGRWAALPGFDHTFITPTSIGWNHLAEAEHVGDMSFYAALSLIALLRPLVIVSLNRDGRHANSRRNAMSEWEEPFMLFAHDAAVTGVNFTEMLRFVTHEAALARIEDTHLSMSKLIDDCTQQPLDPALRAQVLRVVTELLSALSGVEIHGDDITVRANHINYIADIYNIIRQRGEAMTIGEIYDAFRQMHPDDHHTNSTFLRSYMLADERFEAVGRKSTYQLKEWKRFSGGLMELALNLVTANGGPMLTEELSRQMYELRPSSTFKSCMSTVYLAVQKGLLRYLITDEHSSVSSYVALAADELPEGFWPSPIDKAGAIAGLRRFLGKYQRWPFDQRKDGVEAQLYYAYYKYTRKMNLPQEEVQSFIDSITDKHPLDYPHTRHDLAYLNNCRKFKDYVSRHHAMPRYSDCPSLCVWYRNVTTKNRPADPFRKYHLQWLDTMLHRYLDRQAMPDTDGQ